MDADVGQSQIGPPTTIGVRYFTGGAAVTELGSAADRLYFVGDVSPHGHELESLTGTQLMVSAARERGADFIVVDTTGYIQPQRAVRLKQQKIELTRPTDVVCIGRAGALEQIIAPYHHQTWLSVHRLQPHRRVRTKNRARRAAHRSRQFDAFFSGTDPTVPVPVSEPEDTAASGLVQHLPFEQIRGGRAPLLIGHPATAKDLETFAQHTDTPITYAEWGHRTLHLIAEKPLSDSATAHIKNYLSLQAVTAVTPAYFARRLIGLIDSAGHTYAIGVIEAVDFQERAFQVRSCAGAAARACAIQFGNYRLKTDR